MSYAIAICDLSFAASCNTLKLANGMLTERKILALVSSISDNYMPYPTAAKRCQISCNKQLSIEMDISTSNQSRKSIAAWEVFIYTMYLDACLKGLYIESSTQAYRFTNKQKIDLKRKLVLYEEVGHYSVSMSGIEYEPFHLSIVICRSQRKVRSSKYGSMHAKMHCSKSLRHTWWSDVQEQKILTAGCSSCLSFLSGQTQRPLSLFGSDFAILHLLLATCINRFSSWLIWSSKAS